MAARLSFPVDRIKILTIQADAATRRGLIQTLGGTTLCLLFLSNHFVASAAVISPRKFYKLATSINNVKKAASANPPCNLQINTTSAVARLHRRVYAGSKNNIKSALGKAAVKTTANHQPNKSLKIVRCAHWTHGFAARPLAQR